VVKVRSARTQVFTLLTTAGAAFTGAGQIRFMVVGADKVIQGKTDGNAGTVEFEVLIQNSTRAWVAADLIP
jgi:hypothetical protein